MYKIIFYKDSKGREPVYEYIKELEGRKDKDSKIKSRKINDYIQALGEYQQPPGQAPGYEEVTTHTR